MTEETVVRLLKEMRLTVTAAESLTGGLFLGKLVNVPGASDVLEMGFVTYSDRAKHKCLGVRKRTLAKYTAVSAETAAEMVKGACRAAKAGCGISLTGLAGPDGGTEERPVGTVFLGCRVNKKTVVRECHFEGSRQEIREAAAAEAMELLLKCLLRHKEGR